MFHLTFGDYYKHTYAESSARSVASTRRDVETRIARMSCLDKYPPSAYPDATWFTLDSYPDACVTASCAYMLAAILANG